MSRLIKIGDALSQLVNTFPPFNGHPNESLSGRAYRTGSKWEGVIDKVFYRQDRHCKTAYNNDLLYAKKLIEQHESRESGFFTPKI